MKPIKILRKTLQTNATRVNFCFRTVKMATML